MQYSPCLFIGEHHLSGVVDKFTEALAAWSRHWGNKARTPVCERATRLEAEEVDLDDNWVSLQSRFGPIAWICFKNGSASSLLEYFSAPLSASSGVGRSDFSEDLGHKILFDLFDRLMHSAISANEEIKSESGVVIPPKLYAKWSGAVTLRCSLEKIELKCVFPYESVRSLVPRMPSRNLRTAHLERLSLVTRNTLVPFNVQLSADGLTLGNLDELVEGSVVIFNHPPEASWTVYGPNNLPLSLCKLGRTEDRFAIQLSAIETSRD